jgi:hypothetical protein
MLKMLTKISQKPAAETESTEARKPFSDPCNIDDPYFSVINEICDYSKKFNLVRP